MSFFIILVGVELFKSSIDKTLNPQPVQFNITLIIILILSVLVKLWMYSYNKYVGKAINSSVSLAMSSDSVNDVYTSSAIILSTVIGQYFDFPIDGITGIIVSVIIIISGINISRDTIGMLLGSPPSDELVNTLRDTILHGEGIVGMHDLVVHDYGPGRVMASVHAEVPDNIDIVKTHEEIDNIERQIFDEHGINLVIHMDPISINCERTNETKRLVEDIVTAIDNRLTIHDFRMTDGDRTINLIFDLVVPSEWTVEKSSEITDIICKKLSENDERFRTVIHIDSDFLSH